EVNGKDVIVVSTGVAIVCATIVTTVGFFLLKGGIWVLNEIDSDAAAGNAGNNIIQKEGN
ncbi:MAG: hypothetical protein LBR79_02265, partial [Oscillospiraceae bacterium]|nr:hypothetical protein [Oscillospiraceae bacterium]